LCSSNVVDVHFLGFVQLGEVDALSSVVLHSCSGLSFLLFFFLHLQLVFFESFLLSLALLLDHFALLLLSGGLLDWLL
jgi:hypothetical protein